MLITPSLSLTQSEGAGSWKHNTQRKLFVSQEKKRKHSLESDRLEALLIKMNSVFSAIGSFVDCDVKSLLLFIAVFLITADYIKNRRQASFPPGPWAWPIVGNIFTVDHRRTHESLTQVD